jgi:hypothetical protein
MAFVFAILHSMATATLSQTLSMAADGTSETWEVQPFFSYSFEVRWSGADTTAGTLSVQISNTGDVWNCYGEDPAFTFDAASGVILVTVERAPGTRYARLSFTANTNTAGELVIFANGIPHKGYA